MKIERNGPGENKDQVNTEKDPRSKIKELLSNNERVSDIMDRLSKNYVRVSDNKD